MPGEEVIGFRLPYNEIEIHKRDCPRAIGEASAHGDSITRVDFKENPDILYPASIRIKGVDRVHMLSDMIECISEKLRLSIKGITTKTEDNIFDLTISLSVHSWDELQFFSVSKNLKVSILLCEGRGCGVCAAVKLLVKHI